MPIPIPTAGAIVYGEYSAASVQSICDGLNTLLMSCGWISHDQSSTGLVIFSAAPSNGDTVTVGSVTYTFVSTLNNAVADQVSLAGTPSASDMATRLRNAINAGPNAGTDYSSATMVNTLAIAGLESSVANSIRVIALTPAFGQNALPLSKSSSQLTLQEVNNGACMGRGHKLICPTTPQGLSCAVWIDDVNDTSYARVRMGSPNWNPPGGGDLGSVVSSDNSGLDRGTGVCGISTGSRVQEFCGCAHQFFTWVLSDSSSSGFVVTGGVPYIRPMHAPIAITAATNANPIQITAGGHGLSTNQDVFVADVLGNTAANGFYTVTVIDGDNFTLNGSSGNGSYTGGGVVAGPNQIARAIWFTGQGAGTAFPTFRNSFAPGSSAWFGALNQYSWSAWNSGTGLCLEIGKHPSSGLNNGILLNWGSISDLTPAVIAWGITSGNATIMKYGQLWAAFLTQEPLPVDRIKTAFAVSDGTHDCINFTDGSQEPRGSLWLLKS
jgi:hypothetical protein